MFVQTVISSRAEFDEAHRLLDIAADPPDTLLAAIAFSSGEDEVTLVNVWESPAAVAEFFVERIHSRTEGKGLSGQNIPRGEPVFFWTRG